MGAKPTATVTIDGQLPLPLVAAPKASVTPRSTAPAPASPGKAGKPGSAASAQAGSPRVSQLSVAFDRLLLEKKDVKFVTLANTSVLPIKWRITGEAGWGRNILAMQVAGLVIGQAAQSKHWVGSIIVACSAYRGNARSA
jgi:hypothetical protein